MDMGMLEAQLALSIMNEMRERTGKPCDEWRTNSKTYKRADCERIVYGE